MSKTDFPSEAFLSSFFLFEDSEGWKRKEI